jgi:hypothetical protein
MVLAFDCMLFKSEKQSKVLPNPKLYLVRKSCFLLLKSFERIANNRSTKGTPLQVLAFAMKNWN